MRVGVFGAGALSVSLFLSFLLLAAAGGHAQAPSSPPQAPPSPPQAPPPQGPKPVTGFVSPFEIMRTVRAAGFDPLAPPLREGTTYVLRATDFRGILMRVVVDARTGAIRDVNRIVPDPGTSGQIGMVPPPYGAPTEFDAPAPGLGPIEEGATPPLSQPPGVRTATHPAESAPPPLPRTRPPALASRKPADGVNSAAQTDPKTSANTGANTGRKKTGANSDTKSDATAIAPIAPSAAPVAPSNAPAITPLND